MVYGKLYSVTSYHYTLYTDFMCFAPDVIFRHHQVNQRPYSLCGTL